MNLHYEVRICQKIYNRVTMTVYVKGVVWFNVNKTLVLREKEKRFYTFSWTLVATTEVMLESNHSFMNNEWQHDLTAELRHCMHYIVDCSWKKQEKCAMKYLEYILKDILTHSTVESRFKKDCCYNQFFRTLEIKPCGFEWVWI